MLLACILLLAVSVHAGLHQGDSYGHFGRQLQQAQEFTSAGSCCQSGLPPAASSAALYMPLDSTSPDTWPAPGLAGELSQQGLEFVQDDVFGSVLDCSRERNSSLRFDPPDYARAGDFTISFWMKSATFEQGSADGDHIQFVLSQVSATVAESAVEGVVNVQDPNQIHIYLPHSSLPIYGIIRVVLKDQTDAEQQSYLDSDGFVGEPLRRPPLPHAHVNDGFWHMITVATLPPGSQGFNIYFDGVLTAIFDSSNRGIGKDDLSVDGGDPLDLSGPMTLCERADRAPNRGYTGNLAHLGLWDYALTSDEIGELYSYVAADIPQSAKSEPVSVPAVDPDLVRQGIRPGARVSAAPLAAPGPVSEPDLVTNGAAPAPYIDDTMN